MRCSTTLFLLSIFSISAAGACGSGGRGLSKSDASACSVGMQGCACYGNDTCNAGLTCTAHLCVGSTVSGGESGGSDGGGHEEGGKETSGNADGGAGEPTSTARGASTSSTGQTGLTTGVTGSSASSSATATGGSATSGTTTGGITTGSGDSTGSTGSGVTTESSTGSGAATGSGATTGSGAVTGSGATTGSSATTGSTTTGSSITTGGSSSSSAGPDAGGCSGCSIKIEYQAALSTSFTIDTEIEPVLAGGPDVALSSLTLRYWFTDTAGSNMVTECDFWAVDTAGGDGCAFLSSRVVAVADNPSADHYIELSFPSASALYTVGGVDGPMMLRIHHLDYGSIVPTDDYSYDPTATDALQDNAHITAYVDGVLVWGEEP